MPGADNEPDELGQPRARDFGTALRCLLGVDPDGEPDPSRATGLSQPGITGARGKTC